MPKSLPEPVSYDQLSTAGRPKAAYLAGSACQRGDPHPPNHQTAGLTAWMAPPDEHRHDVRIWSIFMGKNNNATFTTFVAGLVTYRSSRVIQTVGPADPFRPGSDGARTALRPRRSGESQRTRSVDTRDGMGRTVAMGECSGNWSIVGRGR